MDPVSAARSAVVHYLKLWRPPPRASVATNRAACEDQSRLHLAESLRERSAPSRSRFPPGPPCTGIAPSVCRRGLPQSCRRHRAAIALQGALASTDGSAGLFPAADLEDIEVRSVAGTELALEQRRAALGRAPREDGPSRGLAVACPLFEAVRDAQSCLDLCVAVELWEGRLQPPTAALALRQLAQLSGDGTAGRMLQPTLRRLVAHVRDRAGSLSATAAACAAYGMAKLSALKGVAARRLAARTKELAPGLSPHSAAMLAWAFAQLPGRPRECLGVLGALPGRITACAADLSPQGLAMAVTAYATQLDGGRAAAREARRVLQALAGPTLSSAPQLSPADACAAMWAYSRRGAPSQHAVLLALGRLYRAQWRSFGPAEAAAAAQALVGSLRPLPPRVLSAVLKSVSANAAAAPPRVLLSFAATLKLLGSTVPSDAARAVTEAAVARREELSLRELEGLLLALSDEEHPPNLWLQNELTDRLAAERCRMPVAELASTLRAVSAASTSSADMPWMIRDEIGDRMGALRLSEAVALRGAALAASGACDPLVRSLEERILQASPQVGGRELIDAVVAIGSSECPGPLLLRLAPRILRCRSRLSAGHLASLLEAYAVAVNPELCKALARSADADGAQPAQLVPPLAALSLSGWREPEAFFRLGGAALRRRAELTAEELADVVTCLALASMGPEDGDRCDLLELAGGFSPSEAADILLSLPEACESVGGVFWPAAAMYLGHGLERLEPEQLSQVISYAGGNDRTLLKHAYEQLSDRAASFSVQQVCAAAGSLSGFGVARRRFRSMSSRIVRQRGTLTPYDAALALAAFARVGCLTQSLALALAGPLIEGAEALSARSLTEAVLACGPSAGPPGRPQRRILRALEGPVCARLDALSPDEVSRVAESYAGAGVGAGCSRLFFAARQRLLSEALEQGFASEALGFAASTIHVMHVNGIRFGTGTGELHRRSHAHGAVVDPSPELEDVPDAPDEDDGDDDEDDGFDPWELYESYCQEAEAAAAGEGPEAAGEGEPRAGAPGPRSRSEAAAAAAEASCPPVAASGGAERERVAASLVPARARPLKWGRPRAYEISAEQESLLQQEYARRGSLRGGAAAAVAARVGVTADVVRRWFKAAREADRRQHASAADAAPCRRRYAPRLPPGAPRLQLLEAAFLRLPHLPRGRAASLAVQVGVTPGQVRSRFAMARRRCKAMFPGVPLDYSDPDPVPFEPSGEQSRQLEELFRSGRCDPHEAASLAGCTAAEAVRWLALRAGRGRAPA